MTPTHQKVEYVRAKAKEVGLTPMWTHFYSEPKPGAKKLKATTCCLLNETGSVVSRGVAVVSRQDNGNKTTGRYLSLRRAFGQAMDNLRAPQPFRLSRKEHKQLDVDFTFDRWVHKSTFAPPEYHLSSLENDRIKRKKVRVLQTAVR